MRSNPCIIQETGCCSPCKSQNATIIVISTDKRAYDERRLRGIAGVAVIFTVNSLRQPTEPRFAYSIPRYSSVTSVSGKGARGLSYM